MPELDIRSMPEFARFLKNSDHFDVKTIEGKKSLREFISGLLSYTPAWMRLLYKVRSVLTHLLGINSKVGTETMKVAPDEVPFTPGDTAGFFTVTMTEEDRFWIAEATEKHLTGYIGVVAEPLPDGRSRFHTFTVVHYRHWTGPVYFNIIRPFHHLVVTCMIRRAVQ